MIFLEKYSIRFTLFILLLLGIQIKAYSQISFQGKYHLARQNHDTLSMVHALRSWGDSLSIEGQFAESNRLFLEAVDLTQKQNDLLRTGKLYNDLATNASYAGEHKKSLTYYNQALSAFTSVDNSDRIASTLVNIGSEYRDAGNMEMAIDYKLKALEKKLTSGTRKDLDYFYQSLGELFKETDVDKWSYYTDKAYEVTQTLPEGRFSTKAIIFNDLAGICEERKQYAQALAWYDSLMVISQKNNYLQGIGTALSNRSIIFMNQKKYPKALKEITEAIEVANETGKVYSQISRRIRAANILREMNDYQQATRYAKEALSMAERKQFPTEIIDAHLSLAQIGEKTKNWKMAYEHFDAYKTGSDSLLNAEVKKNLHDMELKYQTAEKNRTIEKLDSENQIKNIQLNRNRILIISLIISSLLIIFVILFISTRRRLKQQQRQVELKQKLLRTQLNPHFMYNALGAIQAYMLDHKNTDSIKYLLSFSNLMRNILDGSRLENISIKQEEAIVSNYLNLQKLRFDNRFDYTVEVDSQIDKDAVVIPPMLVQPFVENAVEHGIKSLTANTQGKIGVYFEPMEQGVRIRVKDNGKGINSNKNQKHLSHSTNITHERIKSINKLTQYKVKMNIVSSENQGTEVTIDILIH